MRDCDKTLCAVTLILVLIGLVCIVSATSLKSQEPSFTHASKQLFSAALALAVMAIAAAIPYQRFIDLAALFYFANVFSLVLLLCVGQARLGAQRWLALGAFTVQPSEFTKLALIIALAAYAAAKKGTMARLGSLIVPFILCGIPFVLVVLQPDLGTALLLIPVLFVMLSIAGARPAHLFAAGGVLAAFTPLAWHALRAYQRQRLLVFLSPDSDPLGAGYTIIQSKIAIGSGGLAGKGWLAGTQNLLNFLPERHTDFIFSVIGEEWGLIGSVTMLALYYIVIRRIFTIASRTNDMAGRLIACGVGTLIALQVVINIGMTIGLMPVVGIPLALVSYGGSNLVATCAAIGLVLNVGMRRSMF